MPAIAVNDVADQTAVEAGIPQKRQSNYTGSSASTPDVAVATPPTNLQSVASLQTLVSSIESNANQTLNGTSSPVTSIANPGTASAPQIIVVNGADLSLSGNTTGYGILLVTGTFSPCGTVGWNGLVLVIGKGTVTGCGGGNNQYTGGIIVAQIVNPTTGAALTTIGSPTFSWSGGGGNGVYYSTGCINQALNLYAYQIVASHELLY